MIPDASTLRVLYLEDNPVDADLVRRELARVAPGMRLDVATTLGAALELLAPESPLYDVVLTDLSLPDGSGLELLAHVRERALPVAVVVITGSGDQESAVVALKAGADDYLVKRGEYVGNLPHLLASAGVSFMQRRERRTKPLSVLYAEPNVFDVDLTRRYLAQHAPHIRLEVVGSGEEVLVHLAPTAQPSGNRYDVLLLDYRLPGLNALEVVKVLRQEHGSVLPIVLVTGHGTEDVAVEALRLGIDDYLVKHEGYLQQLPVVLEKMQQQSELNASEERYRTLFENSMDAVLLTIPDGTILSANPAACRMFGMTAEEICSRGRMRIVDADDPRLATLLEERAATGRAFGELTLFRKDGSRFPGEVSSVVFTDTSGAQRTSMVIRDATERKRAEEALKDSEARFRRLSQEFNGLLDAIPDSLMLLDRGLKILWANRSAVESIGIGPDDLAGRHCYAIRHDSATPCVPCPARRSFESGLPHEETVTKPDGRVWDTRTVPLLDEQGRVDKVISLMRDVTEHRKMEMQYLHAQKMESIGTLAGGVAHDFNNILTVITGLGQLTLMKMSADDPLRRNIAGILDAADRAAHLTSELLLFSRKRESERRPVDLNEIVVRMEKFLRRIIGEDIALKQVPHGAPLPILADIVQLEQVLMNLAVNARDAMPLGGEFILQTDQFTMNEDFVAAYGYGKPGVYALLTVSDTGSGMDDATLARIFEPFFTTKEVGKGTGLGLAVAYGIVKQHDGFITTSSEPGHGTTFSIYLPLKAAAPPDEPRHLQDDADVRGSETILLAEDNDLVRALEVELLSDAGYTVIDAADGVEAVRKYGEHAEAIDLLVFDLVMPRMSGKEAWDEIRTLRPDLQVIFTSGYAPEIISSKGVLGEGSHLIYKPVVSQDLLLKVRTVLDDARRPQS